MLEFLVPISREFVPYGSVGKTDSDNVQKRHQNHPDANRIGPIPILFWNSMVYYKDIQCSQFPLIPHLNDSVGVAFKLYVAISVGRSRDRVVLIVPGARGSCPWGRGARVCSLMILTAPATVADVRTRSENETEIFFSLTHPVADAVVIL